MKREFEVIDHGETNFKLFLVNLLYRTPHVHRDFEFGYIIDGSITLLSIEYEMTLHTGDFWIINPVHSHEIKASSPALLLSIQVPPEFFSGYFQKMETLEFNSQCLRQGSFPEYYLKLKESFLQMAYAYFRKDPFYEIQCAALINQCFLYLIHSLGCHLVPEQEFEAHRAKIQHIRSILDYVEKHYSEKLLLSDIAAQQHLSLHYLSHLFKDSLGMPFQQYLSKLRCEKARRLLLLTDMSLLDISIACGFSDPKYFNQGFRQQYNYSPKEYRRGFQQDELSRQQKSMLSTQEFLSEATSLSLLDHYLYLDA